MDHGASDIRGKIEQIDALLTKLEAGESFSPVAVLQDEVARLRAKTLTYSAHKTDKLVVKEEPGRTKTRYHLKDGSVYVVKRGEYRYLYDAKTKVVTYEFENGQIERTFGNGIKEIRRGDGSIYIKTGANEYEHIDSKTESTRQ